MNLKPIIQPAGDIFSNEHNLWNVIQPIEEEDIIDQLDDVPYIFNTFLVQLFAKITPSCGMKLIFKLPLSKSLPLYPVN